MANKPGTDQNNRTSWLQQWLEKVWYENGRGRWVLIPFSVLYCAINAYLRKTQTKHLPTLRCPVIVVGNITVGGTGKTPLTIYIVNLLKDAGYKPAIITRGYGGKADSWPQSVTAESDTLMVGDEAVLMASRTGVPLYAGTDRLNSIQHLLKGHDCDVIVSDDGMQHYKLPRDIQIAVIDGERQLGNGYCLPAGPLREKKERLDECDLIVVNGNNNQQNQWYAMDLKGDTLVNLKTAEERPLVQFSGKNVHALTGIGNPKRFYSSLKQQGLQLTTHSYPDHYDFKANDLLFNDDKTVIMTEKDAVKCKKLVTDNRKYWYLPVKAQLDDGFDQQFLNHMESLYNRKSAQPRRSRKIHLE